MNLTSFTGNIRNLLSRNKINNIIAELDTSDQNNLPIIAKEFYLSDKDISQPAILKASFRNLFSQIEVLEGQANGVLYSEFVEHLLLTNVFFNIKEIYCLRNSYNKSTLNWEWELITHNTLNTLLNTTNEFLILKIDLSPPTKQSLETIGFNISNSGYPCHHNHAEAQSKYMILSTEPVTKNTYLNLEPGNRRNEGYIVTNENALSGIDINITPADIATFSYTADMLSRQEHFLQINQTSNSDVITGDSSEASVSDGLNSGGISAPTPTPTTGGNY
jgi:hypothetical protein